MSQGTERRAMRRGLGIEPEPPSPVYDTHTTMPTLHDPAPTLGTNQWRKGAFGPALSALLLALAFAGVWPLLFVALVPWLSSLRDATPRQAWRRGYGFGLLFSLTQLWWLGDLAHKWTGSSLLGVAPWLLASLLSAVYYGLLGRLIRSCYAFNALWAIPLVWAGMEAFRSYIPVLAFPWALLAEPLVGTPLLGLAWFGTVYFVSALVVGANLIPLWPTRRATYAGVLLGGAFVLFNVWTLTGAQPGGNKLYKPVRLGVGQPGVDLAFDEDANVKVGPAVDDLIREAQDRKVDVLVLPEGIARGGATIPPATPFHVPEAPALVFGGQRGEGPVYQSAFAHDAQGWTVADKTRLVIFGEFVPGRDLFPFLGEAFHLPGGDLSAGDKLQTLRAGRLTVGPLVCFEALFSDLGLRQAWAGADVLAVMSVDDWFAPMARARLAAAARWRAVEAGLPLVRAASLGRSLIVTSDGSVVAQAPMGTRSLVVGSGLSGRRGVFPLVWLFPAVALGSLVVVPILVRRRGPRAA